MDPRELGKSLAQRGKRPGGGLRLPVVLGKHFRRLNWCIEQPVRVTRLEPDDARIRARECFVSELETVTPVTAVLGSRLSRFFPRACPRLSKAPGPRRAYPS